MTGNVVSSCDSVVAMTAKAFTERNESERENPVVTLFPALIFFLSCHLRDEWETSM